MGRKSEKYVRKRALANAIILTFNRYCDKIEGEQSRKQTKEERKMKKFVCEVCGSYEYVEEKGRCRCAYCNAMYTQEYLDKDEVLRIAENAILAQEKRKLYDLVQAKYSDGSAIIHACKGILAIKPDDRYADFYLKVYKAQTQKSDENIEAVNKYLLNLDVHKEENAYFVQDVLTCMIKNLQLKTVLSLSFLMELT